MQNLDSLIFPENYFARFREYLSEGKGQEYAWTRTESDLFDATGARRYKSLDTFRHGLGREQQLVRSATIVLSRPIRRKKT